jgi:1-deoxy-D-xylulose-5-phosphate reductoisomerase
MPAVLSAANEVAVMYFLKDEIKFTDIPRVVHQTMEAHTPSPIKMVEDALKADLWARREAEKIIGGRVKGQGIINGR